MSWLIAAVNPVVWPWQYQVLASVLFSVLSPARSAWPAGMVKVWAGVDGGHQAGTGMYTGGAPFGGATATVSGVNVTVSPGPATIRFTVCSIGGSSGCQAKCWVESTIDPTLGGSDVRHTNVPDAMAGSIDGPVTQTMAPVNWRTHNPIRPNSPAVMRIATSKPGCQRGDRMARPVVWLVNEGTVVHNDSSEQLNG